MAQNETIEIGSVPKKDDQQIKASLTKYRNELYIDIREYVESEGYQGPTKRGIRFHSENWDAFFKMMKKIDSELKKRG